MSADPLFDDRKGLELALEYAKIGSKEGGIPIGSVLVGQMHSTGIGVLGGGHNMRIQKSSAILHGEMAALENAGRLSPHVYKTATIVSS